MSLTQFIIRVIIFLLLVGIYFIGVKWACSEAEAPEPIRKILLWGGLAVAVIFFLVKIIAPIADIRI